MRTMKMMMLGALVTSACLKSEPKAAHDNPVPTAGDRIAISITEKGFEPDNVSVPSGKPVTLVFTRKTDSTCAKEVIISPDGSKIERALPLNEAVAIQVTFPKAGRISYACGMDMVKGTVIVQ